MYRVRRITCLGTNAVPRRAVRSYFVFILQQPIYNGADKQLHTACQAAGASTPVDGCDSIPQNPEEPPMLFVIGVVRRSLRASVQVRRLEFQIEALRGGPAEVRAETLRKGGPRWGTLQTLHRLMRGCPAVVVAAVIHGEAEAVKRSSEAVIERSATCVRVGVEAAARRVGVLVVRREVVGHLDLGEPLLVFALRPLLHHTPVTPQGQHGCYGGTTGETMSGKPPQSGCPTSSKRGGGLFGRCGW
eukprot:1195856-Prorocentrum_minimum.AAC.6